MAASSSRRGTVMLGVPPAEAAQGRVTVTSAARATQTAPTAANTESTFNKHEQLDQAIFQLLSAYGCISDPDLKELLQPILAELHIPSFDIHAVFERLNKKVKPALGLEVRSLIRQQASQSSADAPPSAVHYHALVNTEADYVAKEFGNEFKPTELPFFVELATKLLLQAGRGRMSTHDIQAMVSWTSNEFHAILDRYLSQKWLERDQHNYITLGARTYLELSPLLESILLGSDAVEDEEADAEEAAGGVGHGNSTKGGAEQRRRTLVREKLPQILVY
eukprot:gene27869-33653_t